MSWLPFLWTFLSLLWPFMSTLSESLMKHGVRITLLLLKERFNSYRNGRYNLDEEVVKRRDSPFLDLKLAYKVCDGHFTSEDIAYLPDCNEMRKIAIKYGCQGLTAYKPQYALGYILAEGNTNIEPAVWTGLRTKGYSRADLPVIQDVVGCSFISSSHQSITSMFYGIAYDSNNSYLKKNPTLLPDAGPFVVVLTEDKIYYYRPLQRSREFILLSKY